MKSSNYLLALMAMMLWFGVSQAAEPYISEPTGDVLTTVGSFDGFFYSIRTFDGANAPALRGTFSLRVTDVVRGKLTAHAVLQDGPMNFNGLAWEATETNGTKRIMLNGTGKVKAQLTLYVRESRIWGTLEGDKLNETLTLDGARNVFVRSTASNAIPAQVYLDAYKGYYTVALPVISALSGQADAAPLGVGYLTLTVGAGGSAKIAGQLADGTRLSLSSRLIIFSGTTTTNDLSTTNGTETVVTEEACVPVFNVLSGKKGWIGGLLWLRPGDPRTVVTDRDLGWYVRWENTGSRSNGNSNNGKTGADGFEMLLDACGGYYSSEAAVASNYLFTAAEPKGLHYYLGNSVGDYVAGAIPSGIVVTVASSGVLGMPLGTNPVLVDGAYVYPVTNPAQATIIGTSRSGLFKGMFNIYYDYQRNGKLAHQKERVPYAGVLTTVRDAAFAELPLGMGFYLVRDTDPSLKSYNLKRSFPVVLGDPQ